MHDDERRNDYRRANDVIEITEVRLLRQEINSVKSKFEEQEASDRRRILALEIEVAEFRRQYNLGKGFFWGIVCVLGAAGVFVVDSVKELLAMMK